MYRVSFNPNIYDYLLKYFNKYSEYFENLYQDSWIWSENQIINSYIKESKNRKMEVLDIIEEKLQEENILWRKKDNHIIIIWRTKYLFIDFQENNDLKERFVVKISIR